MKKRTIEMFKINKEKVLAVSVSVVMVMSLGACNAGEAAAEENSDKTKIEESNKKVDYTEYVKYVKGLRDWTVEAGSTVDFMENVSWDKNYIQIVTFDDSKVDLSKEGKYELTYILQVVTEDKEDSTIGKTVEVSVVSAETAQDEVDKGNEVVTSEGIQNKQEAVASAKDKNVGVISGKEEQVADNDKKKPSKPADGTDNKKPVDKPSEKPSKPDNEKPSKPSGGNDNSKPDGGNEKPSKPSCGNDKPSKPSGGDNKPTEPEKPAHKHTWIEVTKTETINHPAETHTEEKVIIDKEAWDEYIPNMQWRHTCNGCGADTTGSEQSHDLACPSGKFMPEWSTVQKDMGGQTINHPAETHTETITVTDKEAWTETKTTVVGYKCSDCGATK